jgi:hypothetical protein
MFGIVASVPRLGLGSLHRTEVARSELEAMADAAETIILPAWNTIGLVVWEPA